MDKLAKEGIFAMFIGLCLCVPRLTSDSLLPSLLAALGSIVCTMSSVFVMNICVAQGEEARDEKGIL